MLKRLFDLYLTSLLLLILAPVLLIVASLIRLDSPGPVIYASPRLGRNGKRFGMLRFRTIDLNAPDHLAMAERLTRVGRFVRNYSLDDLPNLFNLLKGDLSIVGPRPTEPERIDLDDPVWQQILTVRPGLISPAILQLASRYNASPFALKQRLELEYVQKRSLRFDLRLLGQAIQAVMASRGNVKARGQATLDVDWRRYERKEVFSANEAEKDAISSARNVDDWTESDRSEVAAFARQQGQGWPLHEPQFCLVPVGQNERKPAIFLKVEAGEAAWWETAELRDVDWLTVSSNRYVCLGCVARFERTASAEVSASSAPPDRVCGTVLDVASPEVEAWFAAWLAMPGDAMIFVVKPDLDVISQQLFSSHSDGKSRPDLKAVARQRWEETRTRLERAGHALDNFEDERALLGQSLPN